MQQVGLSGLSLLTSITFSLLSWGSLGLIWPESQEPDSVLPVRFLDPQRNTHGSPVAGVRQSLFPFPHPCWTPGKPTPNHAGGPGVWEVGFPWGLPTWGSRSTNQPLEDVAFLSAGAGAALLLRLLYFVQRGCVLIRKSSNQGLGAWWWGTISWRPWLSISESSIWSWGHQPGAQALGCPLAVMGSVGSRVWWEGWVRGVGITALSWAQGALDELPAPL